MYSMLGILAFYLRYRSAKFFEESYVEEYQISRIKDLLWRSNHPKAAHLSSFQGKAFFQEYSRSIPILSKVDVKRDPGAFVCRKPRKFDLEFFTSGSSGMPMKAFISWRHWIVEQAVIYRHWKWHGYRFRDRCGMLRSFAPNFKGPLIKYSWPLNTFYYSPFHLDDCNLEKYYQHMLAKKVRYLRGYPSSIKIFADFCHRNGYRIPELKFILTASEVLSDSDRQFIEDVFQVKIGNHYGLAEQIVMFGNCNKSHILHNYNEYGYCELIPTSAKGIFRIIGTNLHNDLMPLFRYDTGDLALVTTKEQCSCGRGGLQISAVIGRSDALIEDSRGTKIPSVNFYTMMQKHTDVKEWQICLSKEDKFVLLYTGNQFDDETHNLLLGELKNRLANTSFMAQIKHVRVLHKIAEGKTPKVIYEN